MNVYIVASPGGHMTQALNILDAFVNNSISLITLDFPNVKNLSFNDINKIYRIKIWFGYSMKFGVPFTLLVSFWTIFKIFIKNRPHLIFSTGSEIAIPAFIIGKIFFKSKTVYLESLTRVYGLSKTGKVLYKISDVFLVQWKELTKKYKKAIYKGRLV